MTTLLKSATIIDSSSQYHKQIKDILIINGKIDKIANRYKTSPHIKLLSLRIFTFHVAGSIQVFL